MRQGQGGTAFRFGDRVTCKQSRELPGGIVHPFLQYSPTHFSICKRRHGPQRFGGKLRTEILPELLLKCCVLQLVRLVPATERAVASARYKPQAQRLSGFLDQADDHQIGVPSVQNLAGAFAHRRPPVIRSTGRRHNSGGADQLDASDARKCLLDGFRVAPTVIVLQPAQHETKSIFRTQRSGQEQILDAQPHPLRCRQKLVEEPLQPSREHRREEGNEPNDRLFQQFHYSLNGQGNRSYSQTTPSPSPSCMSG